ncbi:MAG: hypothetical protein HOL17_12170 [Gammaproteobacteria bacterium]|nr:hypothetical protein [Gammaproteobacteria bacterium]MBT3951584.1 hypothetical protein [Candidatus Neomarinimicrobiota bacterium]MBT4608333.1 hypothetical protein [Thiotrichales bacterium]MBT3718965.1 hypothetical protein [Gammaproteobacteria bacterium]MBT3846215.1 hypothetical protein [Gammaproteobacteria bacterium]
MKYIDTFLQLRRAHLQGNISAMKIALAQFLLTAFSTVQAQPLSEVVERECLGETNLAGLLGTVMHANLDDEAVH